LCVAQESRENSSKTEDCTREKKAGGETMNIGSAEEIDHESLVGGAREKHHEDNSGVTSDGEQA